MARPRQRLGNLPAESTSFVGRRRELAEIKGRLAGSRLLSLVGPGGVGKTRLALRAATDLARAFRSGAWIVELAEVRHPDLVASAVVSALDLRDQSGTDPLEIVLAFLQGRDLLLVVDNCEHVLDAAALLMNEVMRAAPGVRIIATSRETLAIPGEHVVPVPPLALPASDASEPLDQLRGNDAVRLFIDRAAAAAGAFELSASNRSAVVDICRRLDGLPLAIELAAVRTRVLSAEQILERLSDRFALLTGGGRAALPRHQTLRTTIDWSHDLLAMEEKALLRRLCVFAGRFTVEDAESVAAFEPVDSARTLDLVSSLVDKSLVIKEDVKGIGCYRLHETMRDYTAEGLKAAAEDELVAQRCADYYRLRCLQAVPESRFRLEGWLEWMELEIDNVRSALRRYVVRGEAASAIDLAVAVGWYWITRATTEGVRWFDELLARGEGSHLTLPWAYFMRGFLAVLQSDPGAAQPHLARAVAFARAGGADDLLVQALSLSSIAACMAGDRTTGKRLLEDAREVSDRMNNPVATIGVLQARSLDGLFDGEFDTVIAASAEGARLSADIGDLYAREMMTMNQGAAALMSGDPMTARPLLHDALRIAERIDDRIAQYALLDLLGCVAARSSQARIAARLLGAAESVRAGAGARLIAYLGPLLDEARESAAGSLGLAKLNAEVEAGKGMRREDAIRLALGEEPRDSAAPGGRRHAVLGTREADVARLVAEGMSNKQIGSRLFISERTVDSHVRSILNKLGFNSRAQIAAWVATSGP